jgi:hypothetical protein
MSLDLKFTGAGGLPLGAANQADDFVDVGHVSLDDNGVPWLRTASKSSVRAVFDLTVEAQGFGHVEGRFKLLYFEPVAFCVKSLIL